jgi:hypothetical protein
MDALVLQQSSQHFQSRMLVAALVHQDVQHFAFVIDGTPEVHPPAPDLHHYFIQAHRPVGAVRRRRRLAAISGPNLITQQRTASTADLDSTLRQQFFDVADAQGEAEIQPDRIADHLRRKSMTLE